MLHYWGGHQRFFRQLCMAIKVPETVPFRLTNSLLAALGVTAVEGRFRCSAEVSE